MIAVLLEATAFLQTHQEYLCTRRRELKPDHQGQEVRRT